MTPITDDELDAWLAPSPEALADDGFTEAVMRRVQSELARGQPMVDGAEALQRLRERARRARKGARWRAIGAAAGVLVAAVPLATMAAPAEWPAPQLAAALAAWAVAAWLLAECVVRDA